MTGGKIRYGWSLPVRKRRMTLDVLLPVGKLFLILSVRNLLLVNSKLRNPTQLQGSRKVDRHMFQAGFKNAALMFWKPFLDILLVTAAGYGFPIAGIPCKCKRPDRERRVDWPANERSVRLFRPNSSEEPMEECSMGYYL